MAERLARYGFATLPIACVVLMFAIGAAPARACDADNQHAFGISPGCTDVRIAAAPTSTDLAPDFLLAGGHPYELVTAIRLNAPAEADPVHGTRWPAEPLKDLEVELPPGLVVNPGAVPPCSREELVGKFPSCPADSQVGVIVTHAQLQPKSKVVEIKVPLFRADGPEGVPLELGFNAAGAVTILKAVQDPSGGFSIHMANLGEALTPVGVTVRLWGAPADPGHTPVRACPGQSPPDETLFASPGPPCAASLPPRAFLRLPTACAGPQAFSFGADSWTHPGDFVTDTTSTHLSPGLLGDPSTPAAYPAPYPGLDSALWGAPQGFVGCDRVPFAPSLSVRADSTSTDSPAGLDIEISQPQAGFDDPSAVSEADLESGSIALPAGFTLNASVANGLTLCTAAEAAIDSDAPPDCPDSSKLGTVEVASPMLSTPLTGSIYAAEPGQGGSPGLDVPVYIVAEAGDLAVKLHSELSVDPEDGRLHAQFGSVPQIPIERLAMRFFGGERAPFVAPSRCGSYSADASFVPWSGAAPVQSSGALEITSGRGGGPCPDGRPFKPRFETDLANRIAGADNSLAVRLNREDGEQELSSLDLSFPAGMNASLRGVVVCSDADIAAEGHTTGGVARACPADSQVGEAFATIGAGRDPLSLPGGKVYLAGSYQGAPRSVAMVMPSPGGAIDLDPLVARLPLRFDTKHGGLRLAGRFPTSQNGLSLNLRKLTLKIDRPGFLVNPTSCGPGALSGTIDGDGGGHADVSSPLQMTGCGRLRFRPKVTTSVLPGKHATRHGGHPALRVALKAPGGNANLARTTILLAASEQLDPTHIGAICSRARLRSGNCPKAAAYGRVKVFSPLFDKPLAGPIYLRRSSRKLPDVVAALDGAVQVDLAGRLGFAQGRMQIDMGPLPDLPISRLVLTMAGGRQGLMVNNRDLCEGHVFSRAKAIAQNGAVALRTPKLRVPCGPSVVTGSDD